MEHHFTASIRCQWTEQLFIVQSAHVDLLNQIQSKSQLYKYLTIISLWIFLQKSVSPHIFVPIPTALSNTKATITVLVIIRMKKSCLCLTYIWSVDYRLIRINYKNCFKNFFLKNVFWAEHFQISWFLVPVEKKEVSLRHIVHFPLALAILGNRPNPPCICCNVHHAGRYIVFSHKCSYQWQLLMSILYACNCTNCLATCLVQVWDFIVNGGRQELPKFKKK